MNCTFCPKQLLGAFDNSHAHINFQNTHTHTRADKLNPPSLDRLLFAAGTALWRRLKSLFARRTSCTRSAPTYATLTLSLPPSSLTIRTRRGCPSPAASKSRCSRTCSRRPARSAPCRRYRVSHGSRLDQ